jgi:stage II sporulation protein D
MPTRHTRTTTTVLAGVLTATALMLNGAPADAAALHIPAGATIKVTGHGWGHGHGMSQYGARGAAAIGRSTSQILHFYYPRTTQGHVGGKVKVLITADSDHDTVVVSRSGLEVHGVGSGSRTLKVPTTGAIGKATRWRLTGASGGATRIAYRTGAWHAWKSLPGDAEFRAPGPLTLVTPGGAVTYRGTLQSRTPVGQSSTQRATVNVVSLEGYVQGVVPREMPTSWAGAAVRAQAVAARTYAAFEARSSTNPRWNLCDTSSCQVYGGKSAEDHDGNAAVAATKGQVRLFHGKPAFTQFSSSNGGWLAAGGQPYLRAKQDPFEKHSGNPYATWRAKVSAAAVQRAFNTDGDGITNVGTLRSITVLSRDGHGQWNGRVGSMRIAGSAATVKVSGDTFRSKLLLRSTWFTISVA